MTILFDTSVLIAALVAAHPQHTLASRAETATTLAARAPQVDAGAAAGHAGVVRWTLVLIWLVAGRAAAQVVPAGGAVAIEPAAGTAPVRWPDVAYDPVHDAYLAVSGAGAVEGVWISADGELLGPAFAISDVGAYCQAPRVEATSGRMIVAWHETLASGATRIRARVVDFGVPPSAPTFDVSPPGTNWEMGAALASGGGELLVAWQSPVDTRIGAQRISAAGALVGGPIEVDARPLYFRDPAVAYDAASGVFVVAYAGCVGESDCFVDARRIRAGAGDLVGGPIELDASIGAGYVPEVEWNSISGDTLVVWHRIAGGVGTFRSRTIAPDGSTSATQLVTDAFGSYDANGLAYDGISDTFLFVSHGTTAQDVALELSATGAPIGTPVPFGPESSTGNFNPRVAASATRAEWLAATSAQFAQLAVQRFTTTARSPDGDAGGPIEDGGGAVAIDAGARDGGASGGGDAGHLLTTGSSCGCHAGGSRTPAGALALLGCAVVAAATRRRTR